MTQAKQIQKTLKTKNKMNAMKKVLYLLIVLLSVNAFAQKKEVKSAEKALKHGDLKTALSMIDQACKLKDNADPKTLARIYYTKAEIYYAKAQQDPSFYGKAIEMYKKVIDFEKEKGLNKYSDDAKKKLAAMEKELYSVALKANQEEDYATALKYFEYIFAIDPSDDNRYALAILQLYNDKNEEAYQNLKYLYDNGYTGVHEKYMITDKETGEDINAGDKATWELMKKMDKYTNPRIEKTPNRRPEIISNMLYALNKLGRDDEAFQLIQQAKAEQPDNPDLLIGEANYYLKKGDNLKFAQTMEKAFKLKPDNADFAYNTAIGYLNAKQYDKAREYFNKTLEIDPQYKNAYYGLALVELAPEEELVDEINRNLNNDRKYRELKNRQKEMYRKAMPYLEKYLELDPNDIDVVRILKNIYLELEMMDKYKAMKAKLKELKAKQQNQQ